ncbi:uncharacterized protein LOC102710777 [Oryza brachyantha]|nr:uncharacterized protein LOC102710777 [Oryza brachyantha]
MAPPRDDPQNSPLAASLLSGSPPRRDPRNLPAKMHLWPSLRIRDSFKHAYLDKLEFNLARMKHARRQGQGQQGEDQDQEEPPGDGKAPLLESLPAKRSSFVAGALELAMDAAMLLTCCCCCFCCGACGDEEDHPR